MQVFWCILEHFYQMTQPQCDPYEKKVFTNVIANIDAYPLLLPTPFSSLSTDALSSSSALSISCIPTSKE